MIQMNQIFLHQNLFLFVISGSHLPSQPPLSPATRLAGHRGRLALLLPSGRRRQEAQERRRHHRARPSRHPNSNHRPNLDDSRKLSETSRLAPRHVQRRNERRHRDDEHRRRQFRREILLCVNERQ